MSITEIKLVLLNLFCFYLLFQYPNSITLAVLSSLYTLTIIALLTAKKWKSHDSKRILSSRTSPTALNEITHERISVTDCNFVITRVKLLSHFTAQNDDNQLTQEISTYDDFPALFQIEICHHSKCWEVWLNYNHIYNVYETIRDRYPKISVPILLSIRKLSIIYRSQKLLGKNANNHPFLLQSLPQVDLTDKSFLQKMQVELLVWLHTMKNDVILNEELPLRTLLHFPNDSEAYPIFPLFDTKTLKKPSIDPSIQFDSKLSLPYKKELQDLDTRTSFSDTSHSDVQPPTAHPSVDQSQSASSHNPTEEISTPIGEGVISISSPMEDILWNGQSLADFQFLDPSPIDFEMCHDASMSHNFKVRGKSYRTDKKKIDAGPAVLRMIKMEIFQVDCQVYPNKRHDHIGSIGKVKQRLHILNNLPTKPFIFLYNLQVPGNPPLSVVFYFALPESFEDECSQSDDLKAYKRLFDRFFFEFDPSASHSHDNEGHKMQSSDESTPGIPRDSSSRSLSSASKATRSVEGQNGVQSVDGFQNSRFKLIPQMVDGPWVLQMAIGSTPCLIGQKFVHRYFRGENYLEIDSDIGSSSIGCRIVSLCRQYSKLFTCVLGFVIQGEGETELPEKIMGAVFLNKVDLNLAILI